MVVVATLLAHGVQKVIGKQMPMTKVNLEVV